MTKKKFILIVLDSFGIGEMDDTKDVRPRDVGSNTALHLLEQLEDPKDWRVLERLGLANAMGLDPESEPGKKLKPQKNAIFGKSKLKHFGADTFFGHQEIAGTDPKRPVFQLFNDRIDAVEEDLIAHGYEVERITVDGLSLLKVDDQLTVADNIETDPGQAINITGALDAAGWEKIQAVGHLVRQHFEVPRIIAFGGSDVTIQDITDHIVKKGEALGVDAPGSGVYKKNYHVVHIGYGVDPTVQVPAALQKIGVRANLYGKVADIVANPAGDLKPGVDSAEIFDHLIDDVKEDRADFYFVNIQETDLSGHAQDSMRYLDVLRICNDKLEELLPLLGADDVLLVTADHGNDPTIGHSQHTREFVPLLLYRKNNKRRIDIGTRETMADEGATVADFFGTSIVHGTSFLNEIGGGGA